MTSADMSQIEAQAIKRLRQIYLKDLESNFSEPEWNRQPDSLYAPQRYIMSMAGKRLRPVLALMAAEAIGKPASAAFPAAHAVERFHNFTLIHDDIMDEAPLRRGQATVHEQWGQNSAILSGDAMMVMAFDALLKLPQAVMLPVMKVFNQTALEVCEGQQLDIDYEGLEAISEAQYLQMIRKKTSVLVGASLEMGSLCAGASPSQSQVLYQFGLALGMSFQIHDDILDAFGDPSIVGKQVGGDILQNKQTVLQIHLNGCLDGQVMPGEGLTDELRVKAVCQAMRSLGSLDHAESLRESYYQSALEALDEAGSMHLAIEDLRAMALWIYQREK